MKFLRLLFPIGILIVLFAAEDTISAKVEPWQKNLEQALIGNYELAKTSLDFLRITNPGTLLVIRKENISADPGDALSFAKNKVTDGIVQEANSGSTSHLFKPGEKVYVYHIFVTDTEVQFLVVSADTYDVNLHGSTLQTRYKTEICFEFPKGALETTDAAAVKKIVDEVIAPESIVNEVKTATVELGQTPEQVEAALGKPETVVKLGAKMTYVYKNMKVIFQDGKVADVQ